MILKFGHVLFAISLFTGILIPIHGKNILFYHTFATSSHRISIWPLATRLADAGHNVTYIFPIKTLPEEHPKITELKPSAMIDAVAHFVAEFDINFRINGTAAVWLGKAFGKAGDFCEAFWDSPETAELMANPATHFDLILMDGCGGECVFPLVHKFQAKVIIFNPIMVPWQLETFGVIAESASVPGWMLLNQKAGDLPASLISRTLNAMDPFVGLYAYHETMTKMEAAGRAKSNVSGLPNYYEMRQNTSLILHNTHFIEDYSMALPPFFVSYSGMLCTEKSRRNRKSLPEDIKVFVEDPKAEGFVYVSFGSAVNAAKMPVHLRDQFFQAFASFPKLRFLWRWTGPEPQNKPGNVLLRKWFPQQDLLSHGKIKAFITQAGRPSTQEALCYAVPMIAMPIFADQDVNADRVGNIGAGIVMEITTLTAPKLQNAISEIVHNKKYKETVTELSRMFRDRPMDPVDYVHYWVEYVLKYDTELLKSASRNLTWWKRRLLDVYAFLLLILLMIPVLLVVLVKLVKKIGRKLANKIKRD